MSPIQAGFALLSTKYVARGSVQYDGDMDMADLNTAGVAVIIIIGTSQKNLHFG